MMFKIKVHLTYIINICDNTKLEVIKKTVSEIIHYMDITTVS